jgi:hypothetical protein
MCPEKLFAPLMVCVVEMVTRLLVRSLIADNDFTVPELFLKKIFSSTVLIANSPAASCPPVGTAVEVALLLMSTVWAMGTCF